MHQDFRIVFLSKEKLKQGEKGMRKEHELYLTSDISLLPPLPITAPVSVTTFRAGRTTDQTVMQRRTRATCHPQEPVTHRVPTPVILKYPEVRIISI